jgi:hypothetical protein
MPEDLLPESVVSKLVDQLLWAETNFLLCEADVYDWPWLDFVVVSAGYLS